MFRKKNKIYFFLVAISFFCIATKVFSQKKYYDTQSKIKSIFMINFAKYIEWPKSYKKGDFIIMIYGQSPVYKILNDIASGKEVGNQKIMLAKYTGSDKANILYIPKEVSQDKCLNLLEKYKSLPTLIITESPTIFSKGSAIDFVVVANKRKFNLNKKVILKKGLKLSSKLEILANKVLR